MKALISAALIGLLAAGPVLAQSTPPDAPANPPKAQAPAQKSRAADQKAQGTQNNQDNRIGPSANAKGPSNNVASTDRLAPSRGPGTFNDAFSVRQVQAALKARGYEIKAADGLLGEETVAALRKFQEESKLKVSGEIDRETMAALDVRPPREIQSSRYSERPTPGWVTSPNTAPRDSGPSDPRTSNQFNDNPVFIPGTPAPFRKQ